MNYPIGCRFSCQFSVFTTSELKLPAGPTCKRFKAMRFKAIMGKFKLDAFVKLTWVAALNCTIVLLLLSSTVVKSVEQVDPSISALSKAKRLTNSLAGEGQASSDFICFSGLVTKKAKLKKSDLMWLKSHGTPAARIYAAFLVSASDPQSGAHAFLELLDDGSPVEYQSGCEVLSESVSAIAGSVVATGRFLDFDGKALDADGRPIYVKELLNARQFADQVGGEGGRHKEYLVFQAAQRHGRSLQPVDLKMLSDKASPAGRLYAAVLLLSSGGGNRDKVFASLIGDNAQVSYTSGCKSVEVTVADIARQLREKGSFHNFKI